MLKLLVLFLIIHSQSLKSTEFENAWLNEVNELRKLERTKPLVLDRRLSAKCEKYAKKLAKTKIFLHDPKLKNDSAENIAMSSDPSINPILIWKNSSGHRRNMLDRDFRFVGAAMATNGEEWFYVMRLK